MLRPVIHNATFEKGVLVLHGITIRNIAAPSSLPPRPRAPAGAKIKLAAEVVLASRSACGSQASLEAEGLGTRGGVPRAFKEDWPDDDSLGMHTVASCIRLGLVPRLARTLDTSPANVQQRLKEAPGQTTLRTLFREKWRWTMT